jgi:hypothetical protein
VPGSKIPRLHARYTDERREHEETIKRIMRYTTVSKPASRRCIDKLDGDFYDKMAGQWGEI